MSMPSSPSIGEMSSSPSVSKVSAGDLGIDVLLVEDDDLDIGMEVWTWSLESPRQVDIVVVDFPVILPGNCCNRAGVERHSGRMATR
jgi:hypothetical protein